ncbi:MAG: LAGLIDADG family homing endonuclease [Egibacteraceae bacterium]
MFDPLTGLTHHIEDIFDQGEGTAVWAVDKRGEFHITRIGARFDQGSQDVIGINLRDGTTLWVTPDHHVFTELGWRAAGELSVGDRVARPRHVGGFGAHEPVPPAHARLIGYLIGDGYVGGKTPISFINAEEALQEDARRIASELGCDAHPKADGIYVSFSHRPGEPNGVLALARWAGIWGHLAPEKRIPPAFFDPEASADVVGNLLMGIWESDGWLSREQTGGIRCGFVTTSEQLAWQIHYLLLRWGIGSSVQVHQPGSRRSLIEGRRVEGKRPCWQVRVSGIDNVQRFADVLPMWGPKGQRLTTELENLRPSKRRGSRAIYLTSAQTEPVLEYLSQSGVNSEFLTSVLQLPPSYNRAGLRTMLGGTRLRRDRVERVAEALGSAFLYEVLADGLFYDRIQSILPMRRRRTFDIEVPELHNFIADDVVVHNCAPPFKQAEFDILFGQGISREGSLLDIGVEHSVIKKAGAWYTYGGEQLGQGRENARKFLKEHDDIAAEIHKKVTEQLGLVPTDVTGDERVEE